MKMKNLALATAAFASIAAVADVYQVKFTVTTVTDGKKANVTVNGAYDDVANKYAFWTKSNSNFGTVEFDAANEVAYRRNIAKNVQLAWGENNVLVAAGFGSTKSLSGKVAGILGGAPAAGTWTMKKSSKSFAALAKAAENAHGMTAKIPNLAVATDLDDLLARVKAAEDAAAAAKAAQKVAEDAAAAAKIAQDAAEEAAAEATKIAGEKGQEAEEAKAAQKVAEEAAAAAKIAQEAAEKRADEAEAKAGEATAKAEALQSFANDVIAVASIEELQKVCETQIEQYRANTNDFTQRLATLRTYEQQVARALELTNKVDGAIAVAIADRKAKKADYRTLTDPGDPQVGSILDDLTADRDDAIADWLMASNRVESVKLDPTTAVVDQQAVVDAKEAAYLEASNKVAKLERSLAKEQNALIPPDPYQDEAGQKTKEWADDYAGHEAEVERLTEALAKWQTKKADAKAEYDRENAILTAFKKNDFSSVEQACADALAALKTAEADLDAAWKKKTAEDYTDNLEAKRAAWKAAQKVVNELNDEFTAIADDIANNLVTDEQKAARAKLIKQLTDDLADVNAKLAAVEAIQAKLNSGDDAEESK